MRFPQGLKPACFVASTAGLEAVPYQNRFMRWLLRTDFCREPRSSGAVSSTLPAQTSPFALPVYTETFSALIHQSFTSAAPERQNYGFLSSSFCAVESTAVRR